MPGSPAMVNSSCGNSITRLALCVILFLHLGINIEAESSRVYIVYLGERQHEDPQVVTSSHHDILSRVLGRYSVKLHLTIVIRWEELPEVVGVIPSRTHELHTTRSFEYLGLHPGTSDTLLSTSNYGDGAIIGLIDTGIWPESPSFNDEGLGSIPARWRGRCQAGENFTTSNCNKKIIGARFFAKGIIAKFGGLPSAAEYLSPRDANGHGTHTASTAAGSFVQNANYGGLAFGVARGGAPRAHLAIYKACWGPGSCESADMFAAIDSAIHDGVDIISISAGKNQPPQPFFLGNESDMSIGGFHAVARGITVVCSGGNAGPFPQKVTNGAPWILTVAASTIDRSFPTAITLGNNRTLIGQSIYFGRRDDRFKKLIYSGDIPIENVDPSISISCDIGSLNSTLAKGKIVLCFTSANDPAEQYAAALLGVLQAGGAGVILAMHTTNVLIPCSLVSCVQVDYEIGTEILAYIRATRAGDPGLVYDMGVADYVRFLCSLGYSNSAISRLTAKPTSCRARGTVSDLNLPSITISNLKKSTTIARTVTNVGPVRSTYRVKVEAPPGVRVSVEPQTLSFNEKVKSLTFRVTFSPVHEIQGDFCFGRLTWMDGKHVARIPLVTRVVIQDLYADIS